MSILVYINRKGSNLRLWFKLREKEARAAKHPVRIKFYGFMQRTIKRFVNWLASHASEETRRELVTIRWLGGPPDWMNDIHARTRAVRYGRRGCTIKDT